MGESKVLLREDIAKNLTQVIEDSGIDGLVDVVLLAQKRLDLNLHKVDTTVAIAVALQRAVEEVK